MPEASNKKQNKESDLIKKSKVTMAKKEKQVKDLIAHFSRNPAIEFITKVKKVPKFIPQNTVDVHLLHGSSDRSHQRPPNTTKESQGFGMAHFNKDGRPGIGGDGKNSLDLINT